MFRRPSVRASVTTIAAATILVGGANLAAYAASGHPLILGHSNSAGTTTKLKNAGRGPALSLNSARSVPPLVVNSSQMVKHLNSNKVGGLTAAQLNPAITTYRLGSPGVTLTNAQHLFEIKAPKGNIRLGMSGIWTSTVNTDSMECLVIDKALLTSPSDITKIYALTIKTGSSTDGPVINDTAYAHFPSGARLIFGCTTEGDTGVVQLAQPITFTFEKVNQVVKHAPSTTIGPKHAVTRLLAPR
jgi:hypothetical protein